MATSEFDRILDECLERVFREEESVEACVQRYPDQAAELTPLLRLALDAKSNLSFTPTAAGKTRARLLMQAAIARQQARTPRRWHWPGWLQLGGAPRWAVSAAAVVLVMTLGGTGIAAASQGSMPDQPLYPVKRAVEETRLMLAWNAESRAQLHAKFADRRVVEIAVLSKKGKAQQVMGLATDLDRHLRHVQRSAFPEAVPARPFSVLIAISGGDVKATPPPIGPATATPLTGQGGQRPGRQDHAEEGRAKPKPLPSKANHVKLILRRELVAGFQRQEETLSQTIQASRGPDRQRLRQTLHVLREHRKALLVALQEGFEPNLQATPTLP